MNDSTLRTPIVGDLAISLFDSEQDVIDFKGVKYTPNATRGYFRFHVSSSFPAGITSYGTALWADVIANSYETMLHQNVNREHRKRIWAAKADPHTNVHDQNIGTILALDFPQTVGGQKWRLGAMSAVPKITGVASYDKTATAMNELVGEHKTGRHQYTVSMEVLWRLQDAGFVVKLDGAKPSFKDTTPDHFAAHGFEYVPYAQAPKDLQACYSSEKNRIDRKYKGRQTCVLMGGIDGYVHYAGLGVVRYGAEPTAGIQRMAASDEGPFTRFARLLEQAAK